MALKDLKTLNHTEIYDIFPNIQTESPEMIQYIGTIFKKFLENFMMNVTVTFINLYYEVTFYGILKDLPREVNLNINDIMYTFVIL